MKSTKILDKLIAKLDEAEKSGFTLDRQQEILNQSKARINEKG